MKTLIKTLFIVSLCIPFAAFAQWTDGGTYMNTNDNVNVGTNSNAYSLYVRKDKAGWQGRFANRGGAGADVYLSHGAGYGMHIRGYTTDSKYTLQLYNADVQTNVFRNNGVVGLGLAGNVGIGTTNPSYKLHVAGSAYADGSVGIGGFSNSYALYVRKDQSGWQGRFTNRDGAGADVYMAHGAGYGMHIRGHTTDSKYTLQLYNANVQTNVFYNNGRVALGLAGNVGIGTTNPTYKLSVNGNIRAKEVRVETGWSDYVFYDDYQLPTLEEEAQHIEAEGHLLGFESEKNMGGEVLLGDVSKRQQAKIEEMMLHLIQMNKEINQLKKENEELKQQAAKQK